MARKAMPENLEMSTKLQKQLQGRKFVAQESYAYGSLLYTPKPHITPP